MRKITALLGSYLCLCLLLTDFKVVAQNCLFNFAPLGSATTQNGCYTLTQQAGPTFSMGAMWNTSTISLARPFDVSFSVDLCGAADGVVFVLQNSGVRLAAADPNTAVQKLPRHTAD